MTELVYLNLGVLLASKANHIDSSTTPYDVFLVYHLDN
jgi:hypothetical protein